MPANNKKIGFGELSAHVWFALVFHVLRHKRTTDRAPRCYLYTRTRLRFWLPKSRKVIITVHISSFLQISRSSIERSV